MGFKGVNMSNNNLAADFDVDTPIDHNYHVDTNEKIERWESTLPKEYWDYREEWESHPKNRIVQQFPIHLDIEATSSCNLKCTMCPRTEMEANGTFWKVENFDFELYKKLIDEGVTNGLRSVKYNYLGEPLLNPKLFKMIEYAKEKGVIDVMFNTNATYLSEKNAEKLLNSGIDKLFFSFDSPTKAQYEKIREGAEFEEVLGNIKRFIRMRDERGSIKPFTRVSMVLMKENQDEWPKFKALFEPIVDAVAYVDYLDHGDQNNSEMTLIDLTARDNRFCCPQLWQRMFVHPDGVATVCCIDSKRELVVGNVHEQTISEIWQGDKYSKLRKLHAEGRSHEIPACARCPLAKY
ncbi:hypothetical protein PCIT_a0528 [Pseudoalteromonas citrea]|uniref:Radical SAM core domain-containing protein n=2 Tax=Pseudoalteromonas citrea TaxID=43655 RepID=A0AAD4FT47_9GAMM|nr:hypothetical protein PCIT_a0528 [Pseudoalteromonas citrea]